MCVCVLCARSAVHLVRHKESHQLFALKRILKKHIIMRNQVDQVCSRVPAQLATPHHTCLQARGGCAQCLCNACALSVR